MGIFFKIIEKDKLDKLKKSDIISVLVEILKDAELRGVKIYNEEKCNRRKDDNSI